jgi:hypothetical protein
MSTELLPTAAAQLDISGTIKIGTDQASISIDVKAQIPAPPNQPALVFKYKADSDIPTKDNVIPVGDFLTWLATKLGLNVKKEDLPPSLQNFAIGMLEFYLDSNKQFTVDVVFGTFVADKWEASWKPIDGIALELQKLRLIATNRGAPSALYLYDPATGRFRDLGDGRSHIPDAFSTLPAAGRALS